MRRAALGLLVAAVGVGSAPAAAGAASFRETFTGSGAPAFGSATWWDQDAWDVRTDTYDIAVTPNDEGGTWGGHYVAVLKRGVGTMHLDFQGIASARLRTPMLISSGRSGVVRFRAPLFATTGHWWEVAITPADQPTPGEFTAVPARQSPEGLNNPLTGRDDDGSTNGPGHRASVEDAINVISTGFPDAPACNGSGWHARWALTSARGGRVTDHVNRKGGGLRKLYRVDPRKKNRLVPWKIVYSPNKVVLYGDRNGDGKLERVDAWAVSIPWSRVYVNLLYVAYQAGHHPQPNCGYGTHGITQSQSTSWRDIRVSPVAFKRTVALPRPDGARNVPRETGWMSYDLRDLGAHRGSGQPNAQMYDKYTTYLACSKDNGGGLPCPERARTTVRLPVMIGQGDLSGMTTARLLSDVRYQGAVSVTVNNRRIGTLPRVERRPDIAENNGFGDAFEVEAWTRRAIDVPVSALGAGLNTVVLELDPSTNVEIDRVQLELGG